MSKSKAYVCRPQRGMPKTGCGGGARVLTPKQGLRAIESQVKAEVRETAQRKGHAAAAREAKKAAKAVHETAEALEKQAKIEKAKAKKDKHAQRPGESLPQRGQGAT